MPCVWIARMVPNWSPRSMHAGLTCDWSQWDKRTLSPANADETTIRAICFNFAFGTDPLDPGEEIVFSGPTGIDGLGFVNCSDSPLYERSLCVDMVQNPQSVEAFTNAESYSFNAEIGTVDIKSVEVSFER
jgi:hypothetical protein